MTRVAFLIILILSVLQINMSFGQVVAYLDSTQIMEYLNQPEINKNVKDYYEGRLKLSDNYQTGELLESITEKNDQFFPIYFNTLNEIVEVSDGALSEMVTNYCFMMIYNYPCETFDYFTTNSGVSIDYAGHLGYEFYFKEKEMSTLIMNFNEFQEYLKLNLNLKDRKLNETYIDFVNEVERVMEIMN